MAYSTKFVHEIEFVISDSDFVTKSLVVQPRHFDEW